MNSKYTKTFGNQDMHLKKKYICNGRRESIPSKQQQKQQWI